MIGYKILTHDWRSPLQGGNPHLSNPVTFPVVLPLVTLDTSSAECGAGWNFCRDLATAATIAGWWLTGRPSRCLRVESQGPTIERKKKCRSEGLTLLGLCSDAEIREAIRALTVPWAKDATEFLVNEQWQWYVALGRPRSDKAQIQSALRTALTTRGLTWKLQEFPTAWDARDARAARDAGAAWAARDALWDAWRTAQDARAAWTAWGAAWGAWDPRARAARAARTALTLTSAVRLELLKGYPLDYLSAGLREAYSYGLEIVLPVGPTTLGWAMKGEEA